MKLKYKVETNDYLHFANNLQDIADSLQIPIYTVKHRMKYNKLNIEKVDMSLKELITIYGNMSVDCYGVFTIPKPYRNQT